MRKKAEEMAGKRGNNGSKDDEYELKERFWGPAS